jgi:predicted regulator of Ras-like GTPase activity (Roadblock/LC7/MglB family)
MKNTMATERRHQRSGYSSEALRFQLAACCNDGEISAMVIADSDGLLLASSGDGSACEEVAARMAVVGCKINEFSGTLLGPGESWDVQMAKLRVEDSELLVCAVGGSAEQRRKQISRGAAGAMRILRAA